MKKTLLLAFALILSAATFAQQQLATLNHHNETTDEDEITVYYGQTALQQAHGAAVNGDIITLSPGTFNSVNITKAVTIRGAGMFADADAGTSPTILNGGYTITVADDEVHYLCIEGLYHSGDVKFQSVTNPRFVKCFFQAFQANGSSSAMNGAEFLHCILNSFKSYQSNVNSTSYAHNTLFQNCAILDLVMTTDQSCNIRLNNCVAKAENRSEFLTILSVQNSVLYDNYNYAYYSVNALSSDYSIGMMYNSSGNYFNKGTLANKHLYNYSGFANVFKNFSGSYSAGITFELIDDVAASCLGNDGTQVGMYGGQMPFDPKVRNPLIGKVTVAPTTTSDGRLQVDIQLNESTNNTNTNPSTNN